MSKFQYAVSAWIWHGDAGINGYDFIDKASEAGFDGVEIPTFDGELDHELITAKLDSQSGKLTPIVVGVGSQEKDISSEDENFRRNGLNYIRKLVDKAATLESSLVCGPLFSAVGGSLFLTDDQRNSVISRTASLMKVAAQYADDYGIDIALEPLSRYDSYLINTAEEMARFIEITGMDNIGILLDTFHMNIEETSMEDAIKSAGSRFRHFQVCENNRGVPGKGSLNWESIAKATKNVGYEGWISLESFTPYEEQFSTRMKSWKPLATSQDKFASEGLDYLKKIFG